MSEFDLAQRALQQVAELTSLLATPFPSAENAMSVSDNAEHGLFHKLVSGQ